jgi:hypothetical protein
MRKSIYFLVAMGLGVLAAFFVRQRTLNELQSENESQRQQIEAQGSNGISRTAIAPVATAATLTAEEQSELLRLRGQVPQLRSEASEASNRLAGLGQVRPSVVAGGSDRSAQAGSARREFEVLRETALYQSANNLAHAVGAHMLQNGGKIPDDLAAVPAPDKNSFDAETVRRFELVRSGTVTDNPEMTPYTLIAHEKEPTQLPDGKWVRFYIQANGGLTVAGPLANKPPQDDSSFIRQVEENGRKSVRAKQSGSRP